MDHWFTYELTSLLSWGSAALKTRAYLELMKPSKLSLTFSTSSEIWWNHFASLAMASTWWRTFLHCTLYSSYCFWQSSHNFAFFSLPLLYFFIWRLLLLLFRSSVVLPGVDPTLLLPPRSNSVIPTTRWLKPCQHRSNIEQIPPQRSSAGIDNKNQR